MNPKDRRLNPLLKLVLDLGPLLLFFLANSRPALFLPLVSPILPTDIASGEHTGIFVATAVFMVAIVAALAISYALTRHLPVMPLVTAVIVLVFGSLTLILHDELFIKLKPTIIYLLFGAVLLGGLAAGKSLLGMVFDSVFHLTEEGWRRLTLRWALFFFALAILNEIVWRSQTTDVWVSFKVFGVVPLTFLFAALQYPLLTRYAAPEKAHARVRRQRHEQRRFLAARHAPRRPHIEHRHLALEIRAVEAGNRPAVALEAGKRRQIGPRGRMSDQGRWNVRR